MNRVHSTYGSRAAILGAALTALAALAACGHSRGAAYETATAEASRAANAGRALEAAQAYERAAAVAKSEHDKDVARFGAADRYARAGDTATALARYDALAAETPPRELTAKAALEAAILRIATTDPAKGWSDLEVLLRTAPRLAASKTALRRLLQHADENNEGLAWLDAHVPTVKGTALEQDVLFERAKHLEAKGEVDQARAQYIDIADHFPYPEGPYFDDAIERAAVLEEQLKHPDRAAQLLERMIDVRNNAWAVGSNQRPRFSAGLYRLAGLYAGPLHDHDKAKARYKLLYDEYTTSTLRDDALWDEAWLWKSEGNGEKFCERLDKLVGKFPTSRYAACAGKFCPRVKPPQGTICHDYVLRRVEGK